MTSAGETVRAEVAKWLTPTLLAIIGTVISINLRALINDTTSLRTTSGHMTVQLAEIQRDMAHEKDEHIRFNRQVDALKIESADHEHRLTVLESQARR